MYRFRLERTDGSPADPPTYRSTVLSWRQGDQIPLNADRGRRRPAITPNATSGSTLARGQ